MLLLVAEHYRNKLPIYLKWYQIHQIRGYSEDILDWQEKDLGIQDIYSILVGVSVGH